MSGQDEFVCGVETNQVSGSPLARKESLEPVVSEGSLDEIFAKRRVRQPPLILDRQVWEVPEQRLGE